MQKDKVIIYTDGAARGNPGKAGWGVAVLKDGKELFEAGGRSEHATNNQMELTAAIEAMRYLKNNKINEAVIFADSKYVILGITEWIFGWQKNGWRKKKKKPVVNRELWEELWTLSQGLKLKWEYVEGHSGDKWNDRVDLIATSFADNEPVELKN